MRVCQPNASKFIKQRNAQAPARAGFQPGKIKQIPPKSEARPCGLSQNAYLCPVNAIRHTHGTSAPASSRKGPATSAPARTRLCWTGEARARRGRAAGVPGFVRLKGVIGLLCLIVLAASCAPTAVQAYRVEVVHEYPHDTASYTQGLFFDGGLLQESAGQYGQSSFRQDIKPETGKEARRINFDAKYFVEGSVILDGELFILTWRENVAFVYDARTLEFKRAHRFPRQGWGLTTDGKQLIASDGSAQLHFLDKKMKRLRHIQVTMDGEPVPYLNELEWINGRIWANVYTRDYIVIINPDSGIVEGKVDCTGLLPRSLRTRDTDVLNGIAWDGERIFLTGKNWPRLYEVRLAKP